MRIAVNTSTGSTFREDSDWYKDAGEYLIDNVTGRVVAGDFNGDGKDDIATIYDYYNNTMQIHVFVSTGSGFKSWASWLSYMSPGDFNANRVTNRTVAGDFNNDGKDDIAVMYDFDNDKMQMLVFPSTGSSFAHHAVWGDYMNQGDYRASLVSGRMVAGDFNNDGKDDVATLYGYTNNTMQIHVFQSAGSSFNKWKPWLSYSSPGDFNTDRVYGRTVAGDFNKDGKDDIAVMYDFDNDRMQTLVFKSSGSSFLHHEYWGDYMTNGDYRCASVTGRVVAGDFNGDGYADLCAKYDYLNGSMTNQVFKSSGNLFAHYQNWRTSYY